MHKKTSAGYQKKKRGGWWVGFVTMFLIHAWQYFVVPKHALQNEAEKHPEFSPCNNNYESGLEQKPTHAYLKGLPSKI